jgi:hypothetical protein
MSHANGGYHKSLLFRYLDTFPRPAGTPVWPELCESLTRADIDAASELGEWAIGDPDDAIRVCQRWTDVGADQLCFGMLSQQIPFELVIEATELFGREVIPKFDKDPVHRSTRHREAAA